MSDSRRVVVDGLGKNAVLPLLLWLDFGALRDVTKTDAACFRLARPIADEVEGAAKASASVRPSGLPEVQRSRRKRRVRDEDIMKILKVFALCWVLLYLLYIIFMTTS